MVEAPAGYVPTRGEAVWISLHPQAGYEQAGRRPAVVLSYNGRVGLAIFCPITNQRKGYPFEVAIPSGLRVRGVVLADQVNEGRAVYRSRIESGEPPKTYLLRVFVDIGRKPAGGSPMSRIQPRDRPEAEPLLIVLDTAKAL